MFTDFNIHLGQEVEARMNQLNMTKAEFARRTNTSKQNINRILEKDSMSTRELMKYSQVLDYNFFTLFCKDEIPNIRINHPDVTDHSGYSTHGDVNIDDHRGGLDLSNRTKGNERELIQSLRDHIADLQQANADLKADKERLINKYEKNQ